MLKVIVPYRNRVIQLEHLIPILYAHLTQTLQEDFEICVIEQIDQKEFNKGCLFNTGFLETNDNKDNYFCFHDVDLIPKSINADYSRPSSNTIVHPYGYKHCLGGKMLLNHNTYVKMNGFSVKYWGWGYEDSDFLLRAKHHSVHISRDDFSERYESDDYYEQDSDYHDNLQNKLNRLDARVNQILFYNTVINPELVEEEGLSTTSYSVREKIKYKKFTLIKCEIQNQNQNLEYCKRVNDFVVFSGEEISNTNFR
ncbi:MAG: galactosyltransferase-related protein [Bacteroidota bacterium]